MTQELLEKQQEIKLPLETLHKKFGVCFDKKETYTITELSKEDFKGVITINSIIKTANVNLTDRTQVVVIFSFKGNYWNQEETRLTYFNIRADKKAVSLYGGDSYNKGDVLKHLKTAEKVIVIEAKGESLNYPKYKGSWDRRHSQGSDYMYGHNLFERIKFNDYKHVYNEELDKSERILRTDDEVRSLSISTDIDAQVLTTGQSLHLRTCCRTIGNKWGDLIDKSGYNVNAKRINLADRLEEYKASKVTKRIKNGGFLNQQANILNKIRDCKVTIGNKLLGMGGDVEELYEAVENAEDKLNDLRWIVRSFQKTSKNINEAIAGNDYIYSTLRIEEDLKELEGKLDKLSKEIK